MHRYGWTALLAVVALVWATSVSAQGASTTGQIRGQVMADDGQPISGASVVATNTETGLQRSTLSNDRGLYMIMLLPPGRYSLRVEMLGYAEQDLEDIRVSLGQAATVNVEMTTRALELEGINVQARRGQIDVTDASVAQMVSQEEIEALPALGRDFTNFIQLSGLVAPDPANTTGGQFSIAGQRASQTNLQIDGVDANNAFFGENRGGSRIPFVFSLESIREFQVIANGFDVEFGSYTGGVVNVITRGGSNQFEGTAYANYQSDKLTSQTFDGNAVADYQVSQFAGRVSGPIVRDKAHFLLSVDAQRERQPQLSITQARYGPESTNADPARFDAVGRFYNLLSDQYGISDPQSTYGSFQTTNDVISVFGRVDWTLSDAHRLSLRHNFASYTNDNEWNQIYDFEYGQSRAEEYRDVSNSFVAELQSVLGQKTFNVFRFQASSELRPRNGKDLRPALEVRLPGGGFIGYGGTFAAFQNDLEELKLQAIDNFTHVVGNHTLKVGVNGILTHIKNQFILEGAGVYNFPDMDAFEAFRPSSFERNIRQGGGIPYAEFDVLEWSVYGQDEWQVTPKFTATMGLRYDVETFLEEPQRVLVAERAFGVTTGIAPTDADNISPRLALAYDFSGDGSAVLRGGVGYFYGRVPYVLGGNVQSTVRPVVTVQCTGSIAEGDPNAPPSVQNYGSWGKDGNDNPELCSGTTVASGIPEYTFWNPDFEFPETFKANIGWSQQLGSRTRFSVDALFSQSSLLYTVRNLNLRDVQLTLDGEGGRRIFQPGSVFDPAASDPTANEINSRRNLDLGAVYVNYNDGRSRSVSVTAEAAHQVSDALQIRESYTYTDSYDNSSYSCCTANAGYTDPTVGAYGPNDIGGVGDTDRAWGPSDFTRNHTFITSVNATLPFGIKVAGFWRLQSGRPWTPEVSGDLNGDGVRFNDRPFVFAPDDLPLAATGATADTMRAVYSQVLNDNACAGDHVGEIVPRNTCRYPWFNRVDLRLSRSFQTVRDQRVELQVDLFNVLNGINSDWGRYMGVFAQNRNLLVPESYDENTGEILYSVPMRRDEDTGEAVPTFGTVEAIGDNLTLQFQARIGVKYYF